VSDIEFTVVMHVLNRADLLVESLDAVFAQTRPALQVLVVDGGSTDSTTDVARRYPGVELLVRPGSSVPAAHNAGFGAAQGSVIAFASSDDVWVPEALERHAAALHTHPDCGVSVGLTAFFGTLPHARTPEGLVGTVRRVRVLEAVAVRRNVVDRRGMFDEALGPSADLEWLSRLADGGVSIVDVEEIVVRKRLHEGNVTYGREETAGEVLNAVSAIVRRRASNAHKDGLH
jgi:glycosyltransferase involved in cell wall biosynthesis